MLMNLIEINIFNSELKIVVLVISDVKYGEL